MLASGSANFSPVCHFMKKDTMSGYRLPLLGVVCCASILTQGSALAADVPERGKAPLGQTQVTPPPVATPGVSRVISLPSATASGSQADAGPKVLVRQLRIKGNTRFSESVLLAQTGFVANSELDLATLQQMAQKVQDYFQAQGFFLTRAYLPPQHNADGEVTIEILEARYGKVQVNNPAALANAQVTWLTQDLKSGETPRLAPLERALLMLNDVPGLGVKSTIAPGAETGQADLLLTVEAGRKWSGSVDFDANGSRSTGKERLGASLVGNNLAGFGDQLNVRVLSSFQGLNNGRVAWQVPLQAVQLGLAYSVTDYSLGGEFASLGANGTAKSTTLSLNHTLLRSRQTNLYAQISVDDKKLRDRIDSTNSVTDKSATVWTLGLSGERYDTTAGQGVSAFNLNLLRGQLRLDSEVLRQQDALSQRTAGGYTKLVYGINRTHTLGPKDSLSINFSGQISSKNLDSSEKMVLGGAAGVRAYPQDEASGDEANLLNVEWRHTLPAFASAPGLWQVATFVDAGQSRSVKSASDSIRRTLSGFGVGLHWDKPGEFSLKFDWAWKLGSEKAQSASDRNGRLWLQGAKYF